MTWVAYQSYLRTRRVRLENSYVRSLGWDYNTTYRVLSTLLANVLRRSYSFCETRSFLAPSLSRTELRRESENKDDTDREDLTGLGEHAAPTFPTQSLN
jgi:hypothetical protein